MIYVIILNKEELFMDNTKEQIMIFMKARTNLLIALVFTAINLLLLATQSDVYFLFSATIPYFILAVAQEMGSDFFVTGLIISTAALGVYFASWYLSKRHRYFMLIALIIFIFDTLLLLSFLAVSELDLSYIIEIAFHIWVLYYLFTGVKAWKALRGIEISEDDLSNSIKIKDEN